MSLAMALGGILGNLAVPMVTRVVGADGALLAIAGVILLSGVACLRLPRTVRAEPMAAEGTELDVVRGA
jgi:hypothetical protein